MSQLVKDGDRLILGLGAVDESPGRQWFDFQLLSPLLLGLMAPFIAASYLEVDAVENFRYPIWLFLIFMFVLCTFLFFFTSHYPGKVNRIVVDRDAAAVEIIWRSTLSTTSQFVPFQEITALKVRNTYDDDGYVTPIAEISLRSADTIVLPPGTTEEQLRPLRAAIGIG